MPRKTKINQQNNESDQQAKDLLLKQLSQSIQGKNRTDFIGGKNHLDDTKLEKLTTEDDDHNHETKNIKENNTYTLNNKNENIQNEINKNGVIFEDDDEYEKKFHLDFSIENIKKKYIFPFNQTLTRSFCFVLFF